MSVDGHPAGVTHEWQYQKVRQRKFSWIAKLRQADHHIHVPLGGLIFVRARQPVPPGQIEPVIAVRLPDDDRVVDPVHIRGYHDQSDHPVHFFRNANVTVIEHGGYVQGHFENDHGQSSKRGYSRQLDGHGYSADLLKLSASLGGRKLLLPTEWRRRQGKRPGE